ncbi:MAG TPA: hypothetical protein ENI89_12585 [Desulfobulbus sp.]|nr:hypothetical protein [Desulfobulbus sp.]
MVKSTDNISTLLPYLESGPGRFTLRIFSGHRQADASPDPPATPFVCDDSDPLSRLVAARIVTDDGSEVRPVWLRIQRDLHDLASGSLHDLANPQVEECWQQALSARRAAKGADGSMFLAGQIGAGGELLAFAPLFCCRAKQVFFEPPCPGCGRSLVLCRDDDLLTRHGLEPYSTTLRRFLHCPACVDSGAPFYVSSRSAADDAIVHDQRQLLVAWGRLTGDAAATAGFPCSTCPGHEACFGRNSLVLENVASFSFYPFFLFIEPAADLGGSDFLALLGGAEPQELILRHTRSGRRLGVSQLAALDLHGAGQGFLYPDDDPRRFLEVLFLKLSFLEQLAGDLFSRADKAWYPEISLSLSSVAVQVHGGGLLPFFWNFSLHRRGVGQFLGTSVAFPKRPPLYTLYGLGCLWLSALLVNRDQNTTVLREIINRQLQAGSGAQPAGLLPERYPDIFAPAQLFWNRDRIEPDGRSLELWNRVLAQGLTLLDGAFHGNAPPADTVLAQITELRQEVRRLLLPEAMTAIPGQAVEHGLAREDRDREIHAMLTRIGGRWAGGRQEPVPPQGRRTEKVQPGSPARTGDRPAPLSQDNGRLTPAGEPADLEETVILAPGGRPGRAADVEQEESTLILARGGDGQPAAVRDRGPEPPARERPGTVEAGGEETVILPPPPSPGKTGQGTERKQEEPDSLLSRISPARREQGDDDTLAETIILRPDGRKKKQ